MVARGERKRTAAERARRFRARRIVCRAPYFSSFRDISARGRAYNEAPAGKGRAPTPSTFAIVGQLRWLRAPECASQTTHQRHKSLNLPACDPPIPVLRADCTSQKFGRTERPQTQRKCRCRRMILHRHVRASNFIRGLSRHQCLSFRLP
jgi:hypothetical protein